MKMTKRIAPTDQDINRRDLLSEIKEEALAGEWTPEASEIVDLIDEVTDEAD